MNEAWLHDVNTGRPWVIAKAACSLDGKIATVGRESQWLTGEAARALGHRLRHRVDAIVVGIGTVLAIIPRYHPAAPGAGQTPIRVVLDSRLRLPLTSRLLHLDIPQGPHLGGHDQPGAAGRAAALKDPRRRPGPGAARRGRPGVASGPGWRESGHLARSRASWWKAGPRPSGPSLTSA